MGHLLSGFAIAIGSMGCRKRKELELRILRAVRQSGYAYRCLLIEDD
jgi:hypothetical protein